MKTLTILNRNNEQVNVILDTRIDANFFSCKSTSRKRNSDLLIHIDRIISDVSDIKFIEATFRKESNNNHGDEFDGLCQANQIGENPFKCSIMCSNTELNEVN